MDVLNMEPEARGTSSHMFSPHVQSFSSLDLQGYIGVPYYPISPILFDLIIYNLQN